MIHPAYRNELKYLITPLSRIILSRQLERVLTRDPHVQGIGYTIKSLYFDSPDDEALQDNLLGAPFREKFRIRCYNGDHGYLRLEKKVKQLNRGRKISAPLSLAQVEQILRGDIEFLRDSPQSLHREFFCKLKTSLLQPCVIVTYFREPFLFKPGNVRVTLDYDLRYSRDIQSFLQTDSGRFREAPGKCLMEVKYDAFLPDLIQTLLQGHQPLRTAHSKYVSGRLLTGT